jgi:hypothetical protein
VRLHAALGADRDKMTPFEWQRLCDQVAALGNVWPVMQEEQEVAISRVEGDLCLEDLTEDDGVSRTSQRMIHEGVSRTSIRMIREGVSRVSITIITMRGA